MTASAILSASLMFTAPATAYEWRTIPPAYRGDWAISASQCAPGPADSGNIRIGRRTIRTFESRIDVQRVRPVGTSTIEFTSRVYHGSAIYGDQSRLTLMDGITRLGIGSEENQELYVRCSK